MAKGITVVTYDSGRPDVPETCFVNQASTAQIGTSEVDLLGQGDPRQWADRDRVRRRVGPRTRTSGSATLKQELKKYPKMKLVSTVYGNDDPTTAPPR